MRPDQIDAYRTDFDATVVRAEPSEDGALLVLSESVFYPTSGGQPHDTGRIEHEGGAAEVIDVVADGPGAVLHRVRGAVPEPGARVRGTIDWDRRYRHMQRHSAQHLLSQAFLHVSPAFETRSVSLASADATIDLAGGPDDAAIAAAFERARGWAYASLPIDAFEIDEAEVDAYPLRRPPKVRGRIRLVRMGDVELSACGGTHLRSTAETLPLLALRRAPIRGGLTRVTFRAGLEAGELAERTIALADDLARGFSARPDELPERVEGLRETLREAERRADEAAARWARLRIASARAEASRVEGTPILRVVAEEPDLLPVLATAAAEQAPDAVALLAARAGGRATLLFARGPERDAPDLREALRAALPHVEGRGGGKPDRAQGAGTAPDGLDAALDAARAAVEGRPGEGA